MSGLFGGVARKVSFFCLSILLCGTLWAQGPERYILGLGLFIGLFNNLALLIVFVGVYGVLHSWLGKTAWWKRQVPLGLVFGAFALGCMQVRIHVAPGVIVDQRNAVVILAGAFGGPLAAGVAAACAAAYRIYLGGSGVPGGVLGIGLAAIAGVVMRRVRRGGDSVWKIAACAAASALFLMPGFLPIGSWEKGWALMKAMLVPYGSAVAIGIFLGALLLANEERRKAATDELKASERRYRELFESNIDMIHRSDAAGVMRLASPSCLDLLGYSPRELIGKPANFFFRDPAGTRERLLAALRENGSVQNFEVEVVRKDGSLAFVSTNAKAILDEAGRFAGVEGVSRDITRIKRAEEEKRSLEESLLQSQKMESVGSLAGGIAHDFNNILGAILGFSDIAMAKLGEENPVKEELEGVVSAGLRAKELVNHILLFSRKSPRKLAPVRVRLILRDAYSLLRASIPATIDIKQEIGAEDGYVLADSTSLHQVIMNLCANAAQAMEERGGTLTIGLDRSVLGEEDLAGKPGLAPGPYFSISVGDTGTGMAPDTLSRIFDPYFTTKAPEKGTGLGLSVVDGIVKSHGGAISVKSELGKGSTFTVLLPEVEAAPGDAPSASETLPRGSERVLLVDDEESLVRVVSLRLEMLGYRVTSFVHSLEALEAFRARSADFDLLFTDKTMPGMSGYELARAVRAIRPDLPVIVSTGYGSPQGKDGKKVEVDALLLKPIGYVDLANAVRRAIDAGKRRTAK